MKFFDLLTLIWSNLARRKGRVALTTIGVIIGTAAVVLLVSLGVGLQQNAESQLGGIGDLTRVMVYPGFSEGPAISIGRAEKRAKRCRSISPPSTPSPLSPV